MMMIMTVQKEAGEAVAEAPGWEGEAVQVLLAGEEDEAIFGNKFSKDTL